MKSISEEISFDELVNRGTTKILEQVLGGKESLRSSVFQIVDVAVRWGQDHEKIEQLKIKRKKG